jgi:hypothetical protein
MPKRTWWMKRHDTVNFVQVGLILLFVLWGALSAPLSTEGVRFLSRAAVVV